MIGQPGSLVNTILVPSLAAAALLLGGAGQAFSQQMRGMDAGTATAYGTALGGQFSKTEGLQLKIELDLSQASGLQDDNTGIILVPAKGLTEEALPEAGKAESGAPLGYLFLTPRFNPLVDDRPPADEQLRVIDYGDGRVTSLILTARHVGGDEWKLLVFGAEQKPLIEAPIYPADESGPGTLSMRVEDVQDEKGTLVLTVFGKYEASITISYKKA
jgi:hypothetical protein